MKLNLLDDEKIIYKEQISSFYLKFLYIIGTIFLSLSLFNAESSLAMVFMGICFIVYAYFLNRFTIFALTNKRIIYKTGIFGQKRIDLKIEKIESVQIYQGFLGQVFKYGDLTFSGAGNPTVSMLFMQHPETFKEEFLKIESSINKKNK